MNAEAEFTEEMTATGQPVRRVIADAVMAWLDRHETTETGDPS